MSKLFFLSVLLFTQTVLAANDFEGRAVKFTLELKTLSQSPEGLSLSANIKSSEFSGGFYFEQKNKKVILLVPQHCSSLAEIAFNGNLIYSITGELKKFNERFTAPSEVVFNEKSPVNCSVSKAQE